jgi:hypothetical protein
LKKEYLEDSLEARDSSIHGMGVFTNVAIPQDEVIMKISGEVIDEDECCRREDEENNVYIFYNGDNYIDVANTPVIRYINHDCNYNCYVEEGDETHLLLCAARDIEAGEELTIDYGYEEIYELCSCDACTANRKESTDETGE